MAKIKLLSSDLINKIAAGEVVERPASAVKELLENAIDAKATQITLTLQNGGLERIEVIDNGLGMDEADAKMALIQHATSKISNVEDLERIYSLGFRGEALASIASISTVNIHTFDSNSLPINIATNSDNTFSTSIGQSRTRGTTVTVDNIFHKLPARRKFLKSPATEYKYILDTFIYIALSHTQIAFKLIKDSKLVYDLKSTDTLLERIIAIFPNYHQDNLLPVEYNSPKMRISGLIGHPSTSRHDSTHQFIFINNRYVKDYVLAKAVKEGYASTLMTQNNPVFFLYYEIDPGQIDVNIHPRKLEVKFSDSASFFQATKSAIANTLEKALYTRLNQQVSEQRQNSGIMSQKSNRRPQSLTSLIINESLDFTQKLLTNDNFVPRISSTVKQQAQEFIHDPVQFFNTYIIFQENDKLLIVDQHAADERVNYEKIQQTYINKPFASIDLLIPLKLSINQTEAEILRNEQQIIEYYGFQYSNLSKTQVRINATPLMLKNHLSENTFRELINDLNDNEQDKSHILDKRQDRIIATLACHSSIRAGQSLAHEEMRQLLTNLFKCKLPYSCPHGRPIIWELTRNELEKNFKRKL